MIHERCVADAFVPGRIQSTRLHPVDAVHPGEARDPYNPNWPWPAGFAMQRQCGLDEDGCVNVVKSEQACVGDMLNGKPLKVARFDAEAGYDFLTVNGRKFTGSREDVAALEGL